ncbi:hypothetical protein Kpol_530p12 [Vanderwaltozyma polyspora DSM 70294]|uniref:Importin N-terminal domain-containing protein n=1 Tax=Vanderwaltozyma polyspora (strain ATCC 22028 / DSM 70294 / BCRC 21397 / CBS 2163 / NBRC 10782 / NRRL Y-8283 / UCD 57-17) TaxID=436907 RepID=A7TKY6_VANPO|nr:uncharacterized protein Kpol_530p12 [Vanderwaltozyma polyspora DSM 70294]EDO17042.1 hypothetical protein Kpol_530p12 [Vanderwaltozyma polyspora DSM 70294]
MSSLSELNLKQVLEQVSDPKNIGSDVQKLAEQQLKEWEIQPGYHYLLQTIYLDLSNSLQIRWMAVIQFKNGIEKFWRSSRTNAIKKDEKASIRARLFELIDEQNNQLAIQNSQAAAKIARLDFPVDWPNLFEQLESLLSNETVLRNDVKIYNILLHINQIMKILGAARIGRCRPAMQSKVPLIFNSIVRVYLQNFNKWTSTSSVDDTIMTKLQVSYISLKVLRRIVVEGYEKPPKDESVCEFMGLTINHFELLMHNYDNFRKFDLYEKFIRCYGKLYHNLITGLPANFILLPCSSQILITYTKILFERASDVYNENSEVTGDFWEQTVIRGILILKRVINFIYKKGAITLKERGDKANIEAAINKLNIEFLNEQLIKNLVDTLMKWYLKLRPSELESWFMDPEEWINEQMITSYEYQIRPCAENFFQDLINTFSTILAPYLLNKIENEAAQLPNSLDDFLMKDAIYSSFQLGAASISEMVDFDRLLVQVFLPEATNESTPSDQLKIIRRRVALIINEWSIVKCSEDSKKLCYELFGSILAKESDKVVLLTVVQSIRTMVGDWNFNKKTFQPYLKDIVSYLLRKILPSVSLTETRLYVLNTMSDIIIQTKPLVSRELLIEILHVVPELWEVSTNNLSEGILSNGLLRLLKHLVSSLGAQSYLTWDITIPIFGTSCDPSSANYQLLNEDGFELWSYLLQNYSEKDQKLDPRFIEALPLLAYGVDTHTEILPTLLEIVKSYALIINAQDFFNSEPLMEIFSHLTKILLKLRDDSFYLMLEIWEILILNSESSYETILLQKFYDTSILSTIFNSIFLEESLSNYQCGQLLQIIARIAYINPNGLMEFMTLYHSQLPPMQQNMMLPMEERKLISSDLPFDQMLTKLINSWVLCFRDLFDPKIKKVHILGLSSLLRTGSVSILKEFSTIVALWVDMLEEINETNGGDCEKYHLNDIITDQSLEFYQLTPEQFRQHELQKNNDAVHGISLKEFISQTLQFLESHLGTTRYQEFLNTIDRKLMESLQIFLSITPTPSS